MTNLRHIFLVATCLLAMAAFAQERKATFSAPRDLSEVPVGEQFYVQLSLTDFDRNYLPTETLQQCKFNYCTLVDVRLNSTMSSTTMQGSKARTQIQNIYMLIFRAEKKGKFTLGPIDFDGVESNSIEINVVSKNANKERKAQTKPTKPAKRSRDNWHLVPYVSSKNVKVGEPIMYELRLISDGNDDSCNVSMSVQKEPEFVDFDVRELPVYKYDRGTMEYQGKEMPYTVMGRWQLVPLREKTLVMRGGEYTLQVTPLKEVQDFFGPRYMPDNDNKYEVELKCSPLRVKAKGYQTPEKREKHPEPRKQTPDLPEGPVYHI